MIWKKTYFSCFVKGNFTFVTCSPIFYLRNLWLTQCMKKDVHSVICFIVLCGTYRSLTYLWKWLSSYYVYYNTICCKYYSLFYWIVSAPFSKLTVCICMGIFSKVRQYAILPTKNHLVRLSDSIESIQSFCECVHDFRYAHIHEFNLVVSWNDVGDFQRKLISNKWISTFCSFVNSGYFNSLMVGQLLFTISNNLIIKQLPIIVIRSSSLAKDYVCQVIAELGQLKIRLGRRMFQDITGQVSNYISLSVLKGSQSYSNTSSAARLLLSIVTLQHWALLSLWNLAKKLGMYQVKNTTAWIFFLIVTYFSSTNFRQIIAFIVFISRFL